MIKKSHYGKKLELNNIKTQLITKKIRNKDKDNDLMSFNNTYLKIRK